MWAGAALVAAAAGCSGSIERSTAGPALSPPSGPGSVLPDGRTVDKIDILFDIDNSSSMADKQAYLAAAIPELLNRLIDPNCVDASGNVVGPSTDGACAAGGNLELTPVHDLHLGIVTSSLGPRGGDVCSPSAMAPVPFQNVSAHNDDQAHLVNRSLTFGADGTSLTEGVVSDAAVSDPYLYWFPSAANTGVAPGPGTTLASVSALVSDATTMTNGVGQFGCGIESQLESWYRFLIQPDPYATIGVTGIAGDAKAQWQGVDATVLAERRDFLRPDSLVLIVVLSDENDSEIDVRSVGGLGVNWMAEGFDPPSGTSACATNPASTSCQSCTQGTNGSTDSNCKAKPAFTAPNDWGYDLNLRHARMKAKYGVDVQFPIERYVTGLTSTVVPDRNGEYPAGATSYVGTNDCQNPLFGGVLPDGSKTDANTLCHTPPGARTKDLVFYAHIGGVPGQLLHFDPTSAANSTLTDADWVKILGANPEQYDYTGIDPHMIESYQPRAGLPAPGSSNDADPISGHEWITDTGMGHVAAVDVEYACTFPLVDATGNPTTRDCTSPQNANGCACPHAAGQLTADELPPVCDPTTQTGQVAAKAYPTVRELLLARDMGSQGIVSSVCPIHTTDNATLDDPLYGYRPAVEGIVNRLKNALAVPCLPEQLAVQSSGTVDCQLLLAIPGGASGATGTCLRPECLASAGLHAPTTQVLAGFCAQLEALYDQQVAANGGSTAGLSDPANVPVCELTQLSPAVNPADFSGGTCVAGADKGWCYVAGAAAGRCPQTLVFTAGAIPSGAATNLQCAERDGG